MTSPTTGLRKTGLHRAKPDEAKSPDDLDPKRWLALCVIGLSQLMVVLDATIVNVALPTIAKDLDISQANGQWLVTAYALPFGALLLLGGRLADYLGRKRVLMVSLVGFALASALGGSAQAVWMLYSARALQGCFAAMLAPAALSLLTVTFRQPKERATAFAVFGAIAGGGAAVGLVLGGLLTEYANWRWCLFVNIPVSVVAVASGWFLIKESKAPSTGHYDLPGAFLATAGLAALVWGFTRPPAHPWASFDTLGWLIGGIVLLIVFVLVEQRSSNPLLPIRILTDRNRAGAYLVGLLVGTGLFAVFLFLTYFLQYVKLYTPIQSGLAFLPFSAGIVIGAGVGSQLVLKLGAKIIVPAGLLLGVVGLLWLTRLTVESTYTGTVLPAEMIIAIGMGFIFMSTTNVALHGISKDDSGVASAMVNTTQQIGGSLGTALLTTFYSSAFASYLVGHSTGAKPSPQETAVASVHGYTVAFFWAAGFFLLATVASVILINAGKHEAEEAEPGMAMI